MISISTATLLHMGCQSFIKPPPSTLIISLGFHPLGSLVPRYTSGGGIGTVRVECLSQVHNTVKRGSFYLDSSPARAIQVSVRLTHQEWSPV